MPEDIDEESPEYQAFLKFVSRQEEKGKDWVRTIDNRAYLNEFKQKYGLVQSARLACPWCGGPLWFNPIGENPNTHTCRRCYLQWDLKCLRPERLAEYREEKRKERLNIPAEDEGVLDEMDDLSETEFEHLRSILSEV